MRFPRNLQVVTTDKLMLIPLGDIIFLLLIFFMLGSVLVFQTGMPVELPESVEEVQTFADKQVITLTSQGLLFFNNQRVKDFNELDLRLAEVLRRRSGKGAAGSKLSRTPIIILNADKSASYNDVVRIMTIARIHGASVFLATHAGGAR